MAKYLFIGSYTDEGTRGLLESGGSARREQIADAVEGVGGRLESFYFAFGEGDVYATCDLPDAATAAALSLTVNAAGAGSARTVVLVTPEEIDAACKKSVSYRPPGA